ncbi:MAG: alpha/beta hydrolase [Deltaproteobacteria bacterium]|nr:alpha/beta hydrolase [Deltaproteobacteria bacterium]
MEYRNKNATIFYETIGRGRPIVMVHGFTLDHRSLKIATEPIFKKISGWKRIYLDLPGMGKSKAPLVKNADEMLEVILQFIDAIIPGQTFAIIGNSYGGYIARGIVHSIQSQVKGLCLLCPVVFAESQKRTVPQLSVKERDDRFMHQLKSKDKAEFESIAVIQNRESWFRYQKQIMPGMRAHDVQFCARLSKEGYGFSFDPDKLDKPFNKPVLVLAGKQDHIVGYQDAWTLQGAYPQMSYATLDHAGHNLEIEQTSVFRVLTTEWLGRVSSHET